MNATANGVTTRALSLPEELILMLLNEENGYFHQVPGWDLNCAVAGAVLAELSLSSRIDTDIESLFILDGSETGNPALDPILKEIASEPVQHNAQYWIEHLAPKAESIIDLTLDRLAELKILEYHDGDFVRFHALRLSQSCSTILPMGPARSSSRLASARRSSITRFPTPGTSS